MPLQIRPVMPNDTSIKLALRRLALEFGAQQRGIGLVALVDGELVGFGLLTLWTSTSEITDLWVQENQRGQGIGTALIHALIEHSIKFDYRVIELGVWAENTGAIRLYERLGFVEHRRLIHETTAGRKEILYLRLQMGGEIAPPLQLSGSSF